MAALQWETMKQDGNPGGRCLRAKVPGGWLVVLSPVDQAPVMTFYPDPQHSWEVEVEGDRHMPEGRGWDRR